MPDTSNHFKNLNIRIPYHDIFISVHKIIFAPDLIEPWFSELHSHTGYELHVSFKGKGVLKVENQKFEINPGTFFLVGPGIYHELISDSNDPLGQHCIHFDVGLLSHNSLDVPDVVHLESQEINSLLTNTRYLYGKDFINMSNIFEQLYAEFKKPRKCSYFYICSLISIIIVNIVRCCSKETDVHFTIPRKDLNQGRKNIIDDSFNYYYNSLTKERLSELLHISIRQLDRVISEYYGMSFKEKLIYSRLEHAKLLLRETKLSMEEISEKIGFAGANNFSLLFKKQIGISPQQYRKNEKRD